LVQDLAVRNGRGKKEERRYGFAGGEWLESRGFQRKEITDVSFV
jgi:hypothetical protein